MMVVLNRVRDRAAILFDRRIWNGQENAFRNKLPCLHECE